MQRNEDISCIQYAELLAKVPNVNSIYAPLQNPVHVNEMLQLLTNIVAHVTAWKYDGTVHCGFMPSIFGDNRILLPNEHILQYIDGYIGMHCIVIYCGPSRLECQLLYSVASQW